MKVGDLVRLKFPPANSGDGMSKNTGIVTDMSEPTPVLPYQIATVLFDDKTTDEFLTTYLEVISENA